MRSDGEEDDVPAVHRRIEGASLLLYSSGMNQER